MIQMLIFIAGLMCIETIISARWVNENVAIMKFLIIMHKRENVKMVYVCN